MLVRVGHSNDPDDAFMVWALATGAVDTRGYEIRLVAEDIETLNLWALRGQLEVTALSLAAYPLVQDQYVLLPHGASIGIGYGPIVVTRELQTLDQLRRAEILVPGRMTTAFLVLGLALGGPFTYREVPFDRILDEVRTGRADAGLLIHEGQLTYAAAGLEKSLDLGDWWLDETGMPLPLGVNVVRRDVHGISVLSAVLRASIDAGLEHREEALAYAQQFGRGLDVPLADQFVSLYVNELTLGYGEEGRRAVEELLRRAQAAGVYQDVRLEFAE
ncbi:MAG: MqnA/MqnD/SBP family protein [Gaiellaceae bacterium]